MAGKGEKLEVTSITEILVQKGESYSRGAGHRMPVELCGPEEMALPPLQRGDWTLQGKGEA